MGKRNILQGFHIALLVMLLLVACSYASKVQKDNPSNENNKKTPKSGYIFPSDVGYINVKAFGVKGDGKTDDTKALKELFCGKYRPKGIIYFPNGEYLVSDTIYLATDEWGNNYIQGESREGVVIRLKDNTFTSEKEAKAVIDCGKWESADCFNQTFNDFTINIGKGNDKAIGIRYFSNNAGAVRNVSIISKDGKGVIGLDLGYNNMNGPHLIKNVTIDGFTTGIWTNNRVNSSTFEDITLINQTGTGFVNDGQNIFIHNLVSSNSVTALLNRAGNVTLIGAELSGSGNAASVAAIILGSEMMYARDITTRGYEMAIKNNNSSSSENNAEDALGPIVEEWLSAKAISQFASEKDSFNLEVLDVPDVPWDGNPSAWANVKEYGAKANGRTDDTEAFQKAVDSGATTVIIPKGSYYLSNSVKIRGNVRRIIGCFSMINTSEKNQDSIFDVVDGNSAVVVIQQVQFDYLSTPTLKNSSSRTMVIRDIMHGNLMTTGTGDTFAENVTTFITAQNEFHGGRVWLRQFNSETGDEPNLINILNDGAKLWIFGMKTERNRTIVKTVNKGETELLGAMSYITETPDPETAAFISVDSKIKVAGWSEVNFWAGTYTKLVEETRNGETKILTKNSMPVNVTNGSSIALYEGY